MSWPRRCPCSDPFFTYFSWEERWAKSPAGAGSRCPGCMHGPLLGTLILGPLWGLWHLPLFFTPWNDLTTLNVVGYALTTTRLAIMYTWVFNNTKGSVLIAILLHTTFNWTTVGVGPLFPTPVVENYGLLTLLGGFGAFAVVPVALTRGSWATKTTAKK